MSTKSAEYYREDFQGMNQRQDIDKIPDNNCYLSVNICYDKLGSIRKRPGSTILGLDVAGNGVQGAFEYINKMGIRSLRVIRNNNIETFDGTNFNITASSVFNNDKASSVQHIDRVYHIAESTNLCYENGGAIVVVGAGGNEIKGQTLAISQSRLFVGSNDRIYFSILKSNQPTDQLWNDSEASLANSTTYIQLPSRHVAQYVYGAGGNTLNYIFTNNSCISFDPNYIQDATGLKKVSDEGCAGPRAVGECNNLMIFMTPQGRIKGYDGLSPFPISWDIEDDTNGESVISKLNKKQIENAAFWSQGNMFGFDIGDVTLYGREIPNAQIVGFMSQNSKFVIWGIYSFPQRFNIFLNAKVNDDTILLAGSANSNTIFQLNTGTSDNNIAIDAYYLTKFYKFEDYFSEYQGTGFTLKYRPQSTTNTYASIKFAVNSNLNYLPITDPDAIEPTTDFGVIDMYREDYATNLDALDMVGVPAELDGRSISFEIGNSQLDQGIEVSAFYFKCNVTNINLMPNSYT
jgi:hypothetical protein